VLEKQSLRKKEKVKKESQILAFYKQIKNEK
jgi:hypothetical protein